MKKVNDDEEEENEEACFFCSKIWVKLYLDNWSFHESKPLSFGFSGGTPLQTCSTCRNKGEIIKDDLIYILFEEDH